MAKVFGIDLGTTYSCIASIDRYGRPIVYNNADNQATTPSVVQFTSDNEPIVGIQAKRSARVRTDEVAALVKRHMDDPDWRFRANGTDYSAPAVSSQVLQSLVRDVELATGEVVTDVVITVPAYTGQEFRQATKFAGELAGLNVVDIINEPTAAAFSYGFLQEGSKAQTVMVYDLGGGTFDVTVIRLAEKKIEVVATDGNPHLGGADWDETIATFLGGRFVREHPEAGDPWDDDAGAQHLLTLAEEVKQSLSSRKSYVAVVSYRGNLTEVTITRDELEELTAGLLQRTMDLTRNVLDRAAAKGVTVIDQVLLVGGMSKSPVVARRIAELFELEAKLADPDLAVAKGAAIFGQKRELEIYVLESLRRTGALTEHEDLSDAEPEALDQAVRQAASDHAMSTAEVGDLVATQITNVTSRGFGIQAHDAGAGEEDLYVEFLAHAQDQLPISVEQRFYTRFDNQTSVHVMVMEQNTPVESRRPADSITVIDGLIEDIPVGHPQGTPVDVKLEMGTDQVITVTARHQAVADPLVLTIKVGTASAAVRAAEQAKVDELKQRS
ncbi:Hsp70 family protein [Dactylosporangium sp. NBC_01737]|uniref:Hsp70 family protein n=1 Tax=Dactylosporangium sp. NBC_01737 TaxID=2975959 RepID=UPI002E0ECFBF|nr:Hsp70 family protein [Dactylosporangium sp. NBC_01737]